jgi:hypothetical protein
VLEPKHRYPMSQLHVDPQDRGAAIEIAFWPATWSSDTGSYPSLSFCSSSVSSVSTVVQVLLRLGGFGTADQWTGRAGFMPVDTPCPARHTFAV